MTAPRAYRPDTIHLIGRRTERRVHLFRPDATMKQIFLYCLGVAMKRTKVRLHAVVLLSNHYHAVVSDPEGRVAELTEYLNLLLTKTTQAYRGWQGAVLDREGPAYSELLTPTAVVNEIAYTIANPVAAGLVRNAREWPGVRTRAAEIGTGEKIIVERPKYYFSSKGTMPDSVELELTMPEALTEAFGEAASTVIADAVAEKEREARKEVLAEGRSFLGADRALKRSPYARSKTYEPRHRLNPRYACGSDRAALDAAIERDADFARRYAAARERWLAGDRDVEWPFGTYAMRRVHHVRCAPAPS